MKIEWNEIRRTGVFVFLVSIPIMIWKSGHIGRIVTIVLTSVALLWVLGKTSDVTFSKIINRWEARYESNEVLNQISKAKQNILNVDAFVNSADADLRKRLEAEFDKGCRDIKDSFSKMDEEISRLESGIAIVNDKERGEIKERVLELKEQILVGKKNVNSKEERLKFENILSNIKLLKPEEKKRFLDDLKESGFKVEQEENKIRAIRGQTVFASFDSSWIVTAGRREQW